MIKEFKGELQAKAIADSLGLIITKCRGVYIISNSKEELLVKYNLGYYNREDIFYDKDVFREDEDGYIIIKNKNIIDASSIELPYGIRDCSYMFWSCDSLETPPKIPKGVKSCDSMFCRCFSLKEAPVIPEGVQKCFNMFGHCTSLVTPPLLPKGIKDCSFMFSRCTSLETPPKIPEGVKDCSYMFESWISLEIPPKIPESVEDCTGMFQGCISLKECPRFPKNCTTQNALKGTPFTEVKL